MLNLKVLIRILNLDYSIRLLYIILTISLIPLVDCYLIILLSHFLGEFLFLSILLFLSLAGFILSVRMMKKNIFLINEHTGNNIFSGYYYHMLPGTIMASVFCIMPGIFGSLIGFFLCIPYFRYKSGKLISRVLRIDWKEIHEYLNIMD